MWKWLDGFIFRITVWLNWTGYKQMKILVTRLDSTDHGIFGHLTIDCDPFQCVTLERHDLAIPEGTYKVTMYESPSHGLVPLLHDVPNRTWVEIHEGNWEKDSKGCILVGRCRDGYAIDSSKLTLVPLVNILKKANDIWITIK